MIKSMYMGHLGSKVGLRQRSFIICTRHRMLQDRSNKGEWDVQQMWNARETWNMCTKL